MLLLFAAMQIATSGAERHVAPINPGSWITTDDYPADALTLHQEGGVAFDVGVDSSGAVIDCTITASSGVKILDDKTCELIKTRAHFSPEIAPTGNAVAARYRSRVNWTLPSSLGGTIMQVTISTTAGGFRCSVAYQNTDMPWVDPRCEMFGAALTREGRSFPVTMPEVFSGPPAADSGPRTAWVTNDDYPIDALRNHWEGKSSFLLDIDANGHVTKCAITSSAGHKSLDDETCRIMTTRAHFSPAKGADGVTTLSHYASSIKWQIPNR